MVSEVGRSSSWCFFSSSFCLVFATMSRKICFTFSLSSGDRLFKAALRSGVEPIRALFGQMSPKTRDAKVVEEKLADVTTRLDQVEALLAPNGPWAIGNMFTLADAALAPTLFFAVNLLPAFGAKSPLEGRPKLTAWWGRVQERPSTKKVLGEQAAAMAAMQRRG